MKSKISKGLVCLIISLVIVNASLGSAYATAYTMNVTKYAQEKTNWCWVACAKMIGAYYGRLYAQSDICQYVKGSVVNQTASLSEVTSAINYASNRSVMQAGVAKLDAFINEARNNRPSVLRIGWNSGGGHVYVVRGAQEEMGPALGGLFVIDPISGRANAFYEYSKLVNGTTLASGTGKYTHTWWVF